LSNDAKKRSTLPVKALRGWKPMKPDEIRNGHLRTTVVGRRGYRPEDVDLLLSLAASEIERWARAYAESEAEVCRLRDYYRNQGEDVDQDQEETQLASTAVRILARAQAYADRVIAEAQVQARHVQDDARAHAETIVASARRDAEHAARVYRSRAGVEYSADREEIERLTAWAQSVLTTVQSAQTQLAATGEAVALQMAKFVPGTNGWADVTQLMPVATVRPAAMASAGASGHGVRTHRR
jgi:cell division septum initiation protein DivIVA